MPFNAIRILDESRRTNHPSPAERAPKLRGKYWLIIIVPAIVLAFAFYINGLSRNPPGFYVDESGIAYNAFLIAHTGKGEFGQRFPLFFQFYTNGWTEWANPTQIYLLAIPFRFFRPSIHLARTYSAFWVFLACLLLGFLAKQISGRRIVAVLVANFVPHPNPLPEGEGDFLDARPSPQLCLRGRGSLFAQLLIIVRQKLGAIRIKHPEFCQTHFLHPEF